MHGPQQPYPAQHPYQQPYPFQQYPQLPLEKRRTGLIITAVLAAILLVGGGVTAAILIKSDSGEASAQEPEAADISVIAQKAEPEPFKYGDLAVIDACTVMPATLIEEIGFRDAAHGWHSQSYLPQSVPVADATVRDETDAISTCLYESTAEGGIERFTLSISQLPFNDVLPADYQGKDDTPVTAAGLRRT